MFEPAIILVLFLLIVLVMFLVFIIIKLNQLQGKDSNQTIIHWLKSTQSSFMQTDKNISDTLLKSYSQLSDRLDQTTKIISDLKTETGKFNEIGRSMQGLQDFLNAPKVRGIMGEQILTSLLSQILPSKAYKIQHRFSTGDIVDAVIITESGLIPIDSKFPLENFAKIKAAKTKQEEEAAQKYFINDVKKHIKSISMKYIQTSEKTTDFALMYIPAESVYYEITTISQELDNFARDARVMPVSPSTFYAFLRTVLLSFEGQRIQSETAAILQTLRSIQKDAQEFSQKMMLLNKHVNNAYHTLGDLTSDFQKIQIKIDQTKKLGSG